MSRSRHRSASGGARQQLGEICGWFPDGCDTRDLQEARVLLRELSGLDAASAELDRRCAAFEVAPQ